MGSVVTSRLREHQRELGTHRAPDARVAQYRADVPPVGSFMDLAKSSVAATLGIVGDVLSDYQPPGWETEVGMATGGDKDNPVVAEIRTEFETRAGREPKDQEFTTAWWQDRFGANPNTMAAQIGEWVDPRAAGKKTIPILAGALAGEEAIQRIGRLMGRNKRTIRENLQEAEKLIHTQSPQQTWLETGWVLDPEDAQWKYQINSWDTKINDGKIWELELDPSSEQTVKLHEIWEAPEIYRAYPELRDVSVIFTPRQPGSDVLGSATMQLNKIEIPLDPFNNNINQLQRTLTHEAEHFIQWYEGHGLGASYVDVPNSPAFLADLEELPVELAEKTFTNKVLKYMITNNKKDEFGFKPDRQELISSFLEQLKTETGLAPEQLSSEALNIVQKYSAMTSEFAPFLREQLLTEEFMKAKLNVVIKSLENNDSKPYLQALQKGFFDAYRTTLGEVNARLTEYDTFLARTPEGRRVLETMDPISRRTRMLTEEEGLSPESITVQNVIADPRSEAARLVGTVSNKEKLAPLLESIKNHLRSTAESETK